MLIDLHTSKDSSHQSQVQGKVHTHSNQTTVHQNHQLTTTSTVENRNLLSQPCAYRSEAKVWCGSQTVEPRPSICMLHEDRRVDVVWLGWREVYIVDQVGSEVNPSRGRRKAKV
jgi:hypothetical protein